MKKITLSLSFLALACAPSMAQWSFKTINSDFDGSFKKAYTPISTTGYLFMEEINPNDTANYKLPVLALRGSYFCDDEATIDLILVVNGVNKKYQPIATKSTDSKYYFFNMNIWTDEFISDFKNASKCMIRANQEHCTDDLFTFNMDNSAQAFTFLTNNK
jgi:hypothetical protein